MLRHVLLAGALVLSASHLTAQNSAAPATATGDAVARIAATHTLVCGIDQSEAEYTLDEDHGPRVAFDQQMCRAVAVAIAGVDAKVEFKGYPDEETALADLRAGEIDLVPSVTINVSHRADATLELTQTVLIDGVGLLVPTKTHITTAKELSGRKVCFLAETEHEAVLQTAFAARGINLLPYPFQEEGEMEAAYSSGNCVAIGADRTRLAAIRVSFGEDAKDHLLLPDHFDDEPMAMATRATDAHLRRIADSVLAVLLSGEEVRTTEPHVDSLLRQRLSGKTLELGHPLGLRATWAAEVLATVGDYGEIYERTLGSDSPMQLPRGINRLCSQGGALCATQLK
ncbi:MAG: transporter substrate-binding domain-containing protein [Acidobacteriaceae bacterium]|nr:transporter substrate-binding domain-containing protein [Acidobacteriaceae bacterium]